MKLTTEQADWVGDALAIVQIVRREGNPPLDPEAMAADLEFLMGHVEEDLEKGKAYLAGVLGVLAALVAGLADDEDLEEIALRLMEQRP